MSSITYDLFSTATFKAYSSKFINYLSHPASHIILISPFIIFTVYYYGYDWPIFNLDAMRNSYGITILLNLFQKVKQKYLKMIIEP